MGKLTSTRPMSTSPKQDSPPIGNLLKDLRKTREIIEKEVKERLR